MRRTEPLQILVKIIIDFQKRQNNIINLANLAVIDLVPDVARDLRIMLLQIHSSEDYAFAWWSTVNGIIKLDITYLFVASF